MEEPRFDVTISRRRFLGGIGTTAAGVTAIAALGAQVETGTRSSRTEAAAPDQGNVIFASSHSYDLPQAASYIAQQRGNVPLSSRGSRATTLR